MDDASSLFDLESHEVLIVILLAVAGGLWARLEKHVGALHERISNTGRKITDHEVACARREGEVSTKLDNLERQYDALSGQIDRYTDARFDALEQSVKRREKSDG